MVSSQLPNEDEIVRIRDRLAVLETGGKGGRLPMTVRDMRLSPS